MFDQGQFYPGQPIQFMEGLLNPIIGVNQYLTFFSEYTVGAQPSDWTSRWVAGGFAALVQTVPGSLGGKALRWTKTAANRQALSWNRVPNTADVEILTRMRAIEAWVINDNLIAPWARGAGAAASEAGYRSAPGGQTSGTQYVTQMGKYVGGTFTALGVASFGPSPNLVVNDWLWTRFRVNGTSLSRKTWHDGAAEPGAYDETVVDASVAAAGWVGLTQVTTNPDVEIDFFSVGLNGEVAPSP
ncbi:hypothetical protein EOB59_03280 [Mesorhizobium sp. M7A.F.Ca.MR.176.00.0.0]|uniref:hypothetical protein n=1 Tax=Mesorhizobium sp. M7A.F.Ca.MR.176.00.0.0 TaxID=2496776 RepID=UPI000FD20E09|nr:hypothetical protein [Mesorhizobium sp. M7A.F.Ca.MR.176.00.0.0]RUU93339.1 hypothetical protein EOB59_03280 [Mesorhizobium sp. M7A.F.Ca.MR.176.00.0.0]